MDKSKIQALITLLDDPSEEIFLSVEEELLKEPVEIVADLESAWESSKDNRFQERVENIIHTLQFKDIKSTLKQWVISGGNDLLYGAFLICKYQYPDLKFEALNDQINVFRRDAWLELNEHLTSLEKVRVINHILFDVYKFTRNNSDFFAPQNSYISDVLDSKKGNPLSLSIIYSIIAQRLGMPVYGVNLPKNFILAYLDESNINSLQDEYNSVPVLFYVNPINKGSVLGKREIDFFIKQQKLEAQPSFYNPCNNVEIIKRILENLLFAYSNLGHTSKVEEVKELMEIIPL